MTDKKTIPVLFVTDAPVTFNVYAAWIYKQSDDIALIHVDLEGDYKSLKPAGISFDPDFGMAFFIEIDNDALVGLQLVGYEAWDIFSVSLDKSTAYVTLCLKPTVENA